MKKTVLEQTILRIFIDYDDGELPDHLDEWIEKYLPTKNRAIVKDKDRCIANTCNNTRCTKRIFNSTHNNFCFQHNIIFNRDKQLQYGVINETPDDINSL